MKYGIEDDKRCDEMNKPCHNKKGNAQNHGSNLK